MPFSKITCGGLRGCCSWLLWGSFPAPHLLVTASVTHSGCDGPSLRVRFSTVGTRGRGGGAVPFP